MADGAAGDGGIEILSKAGALVDALAQGGHLSVGTLAQSVGEPTSSTYRLLQSLQALDWVEPAPARGTYRLGLAFLRVGGAIEESLDVRTVAGPHLRALRQGADVAALLCYRKGAFAVCVERLEGRDVRSVAMQVGDSLPLHVGGAPLALLANLPRGEQHAVIEHLAGAGDSLEHPLPPTSELEARLAEVREQGYARSDQDVTVGIAAFGSPIFNHRGELVASVSVSGLRERLIDREQELAQMVRETAAAIGAELGHAPASDEERIHG